MLEISTSDIFTWLFQRSLSSSFLKVWPCGSLLTAHPGEFHRNSDPRALVYRVGICREDQSLCILITSTESTIQSQVHEHYFHGYALVPIWLMQKPFFWELTMALVVVLGPETPKPCVAVLMGNHGILDTWGSWWDLIFALFPELSWWNLGAGCLFSAHWVLAVPLLHWLWAFINMPFDPAAL